MKVVRPSPISVRGDDGKYYRFEDRPYNLPAYYDYFRHHENFARHNFEYAIRHMTDSLYWCDRRIRPISCSMFEHDYKEIVGYRTHLLGDYARKYPDAYVDFIAEHPEVLLYDKY